MELVLTWNPHPYWVAFIMLISAKHTIRGEEYTPPYRAMRTLTYTVNGPTSWIYWCNRVTTSWEKPLSD